MATLNGKKVSESYKDLLQVSNSNSGVDATLRTVEDGEGTSAGIQLSATDTSFNGNHILKEQGRQNHVANTMSSPYYRFDGTNDYISLGTDAKLDITLAITLSSWVRGYSSAGDTSFFIICRDDDATHQQYFINFSSSNLSFRIFDGGSAQTVSYSIDLRDDKWHHVAGTYDGSNLKLYLDGVEVATQAYSGDIDSEGTNEPVFIGQRGDNARRFYGDIAQAQIFNLALSATEIKNLYSGESLPYKYQGADNTHRITNGTASYFDAISGSGRSSSTTAIEFTSTSWGSGALQFSSTLEKDKIYRITFTGVSGTGSGCIVRFGTAMTNGTTATDIAASGTWLSTPTGFSSIPYAFTSSANYGGYWRGLGTEVCITFKNFNDAGQTTITNLNVVEVGCVAEFDGTGVASDKWFDKSGNDLHGDVTTADVANVPSGDDGLVYEEGLFTPTLITSGTGFDSVTYDSATGGQYVRVGNLVHVQGFLSTDAITVGSASGNMAIGGLPFALNPVSSGLQDGHSSFTVGVSKTWAGENPTRAVADASTNQFGLYYQDHNADYGIVVVADVGTGTNNNIIYFSGTYKV